MVKLRGLLALEVDTTRLAGQPGLAVGGHFAPGALGAAAGARASAIEEVDTRRAGHVRRSGEVDRGEVGHGHVRDDRHVHADAKIRRRRRRDAAAEQADLAPAAHRAAGTTVGVVGREVDFATVGDLLVAVGVAHVAHANGASAASIAHGRPVARNRAHHAARAAVVHVGKDVHLAAVASIAVAVAIALLAGADTTGTGSAHSAGVGRDGAGLAAAVAVLRVAAEVDARAAALAEGAAVGTANAGEAHLAHGAGLAASAAVGAVGHGVDAGAGAGGEAGRAHQLAHAGHAGVRGHAAVAALATVGGVGDQVDAGGTAGGEAALAHESARRQQDAELDLLTRADQPLHIAHPQHLTGRVHRDHAELRDTTELRRHIHAGANRGRDVDGRLEGRHARRHSGASLDSDHERRDPLDRSGSPDVEDPEPLGISAASGEQTTQHSNVQLHFCSLLVTGCGTV